MKIVPAILGPTASGKTDLSIRLAKKINGEVIGLDSRQIYQNIPIGTVPVSYTHLRAHET